MNTSPHPQSAAEKAPSKRRDVLQHLLDCHEDIRCFTALAVQLGHAQGASPSDISGTAARVVTYFTHRLPRHFADEDSFLLPRLFTTTIPLELMRHLRSLAWQHEEIEKSLNELVPLWRAVRDAPERYPELAEHLARGARQLMVLMEEHVVLEERYLFPLIRSCLPAGTLEDLAVELLSLRDRLN